MPKSLLTKKLETMRNDSRWDYSNKYYVSFHSRFSGKMWSIRTTEKHEDVITSDNVNEVAKEIIKNSNGKINYFGYDL